MATAWRAPTRFAVFRPTPAKILTRPRKFRSSPGKTVSTQLPTADVPAHDEDFEDACGEQRAGNATRPGPGARGPGAREA